MKNDNINFSYMSIDEVKSFLYEYVNGIVDTTKYSAVISHNCLKVSVNNSLFWSFIIDLKYNEYEYYGSPDKCRVKLLKISDEYSFFQKSTVNDFAHLSYNDIINIQTIIENTYI